MLPAARSIKPPFAAVFAAFALVVMAGCASRRLDTPPIIDRSAELRPAKPDATPGAVTASVDGRGQTYTVQRGDTIFNIARQFGQTPRDLVAWNGLDERMIVAVGQTLRVTPPDAAPVATTQAVGSATVEQRPLGVPAPSVVPLPPAASGATAPQKTGPLGVKRPFSEAALADLSKPDAGSAAPPAAVQAAPTADAQKPADAAGADAPVAWAWPAPGKVVEGFAEGKSKGVDIAGKTGEAVLAAADGRVLYVGSGVRGYGNLVIVKHNANIVSVYAHNRANFVKEQDAVKKGQKIAEMGSSDSDQVKLHFEIRNLGKPVDPQKYLPER